MAYLKVYYSVEFMCNLLSSEIANNDQNERLNSYIKEAGRMGLKCYPPHINRSGLDFRIDATEKEEVLRMPLTILKGVGEKAVRNIVQNQPFKDLRDFLSKIDGTSVNIRVFTALVNYGCMDEAWKVSHKQLLDQHEVFKKEVSKSKKDKKDQDSYMNQYGEGSLFDTMNHDDAKV
jgi:DNA polymerase-3 subunit alpha